MSFKFPFTNYHELNLDWILKKVETLSVNAEADANTIATYEERLQTAETQAQNAETSAANAQSAATSADSVAENALTTANSAQSSADASGALASQAATKADAAQSAAESARQSAETAQATAANFDGRITSSEQQASEALNMAQRFDEQARAAITTANNAANVATEAQTLANTTALELARQRTELETIGSQQTTAINNAGATQVNAINNAGRTQVTNINNAGQAVLDSIPADYINGVELVKDYTLGLYPQIEIDDVAIVSFNNGADNIPVKELKVNIVPMQTGTGVPSPDNIRPFIGRTELSIFHSGTDMTTPETLNIIFPSSAGTVYGGIPDIITGELPVTYGIIDLGSLNWTKGADSDYAYSNIPDKAYGNANLLCDSYFTTTYVSAANMEDLTIKGAASSHSIFVKNRSFATSADYKTGLSGVMCVYELETPRTYQFPAQQVKTLLGDNNVWSDAGNISMVYRADLSMYITENSIANYTRFASMIAGVETGLTASKTYSAGDYFIVGQKLYKALTNIATGATFTLGTNCEETTVGAELILAQ